MKLTKLTTLVECEKIWRELAENGNNIKPDTEFRNDCPCCEYIQLKGRSCINCPLIKLWPNGYGSADCGNEYSPYYLWSDINNTIKDKKKYALQIASFCRKEIKKYWRKHDNKNRNKK